jgi:hypothetical protein
MTKFKLPGLAVLMMLVATSVARAAEPAYEIAVASGTLTKVEMGKKLTFTPDEMGKPGKQVTVDVLAESVFLEVSAVTTAGGAAVKAIKQADLQPGQKQPVSLVYAKVGDSNQLLALVAVSGKLPKGFVVDGTRGILNKVDMDKTITMQPFIDGKFGKQEEVAVLAGSKFFEISPKDDPKRTFEFKATKLTDLTPKRQAIAVLFARMNNETAVLALIAQPAKEK